MWLNTEWLKGGRKKDRQGDRQANKPFDELIADDWWFLRCEWMFPISRRLDTSAL